MTTFAREVSTPVSAEQERPGLHRTALDRDDTFEDSELLIEGFEVRRLTPDGEDSWHAYGVLRAKTYVKGRGLLDEDAVNEHGEEFDEDDDRSIHFGVFNKKNDIIGSVRLIERLYDRAPLPVEDYFGVKAEQPSFEASRLIVDRDHVAIGTQEHEAVYLSLLRTMTHTAASRDVPYVYATLEKPLISHLKRTGIPVESLSAKPREVYNTPNYAVRFEIGAVIDGVAAADRRRRERGSPEIAGFFRLAQARKGLGRVAVSDFVQNMDQFERNLGFFSEREQRKLLDSHIAIAGTGGDGGQLAMDLARMGVGSFTLADPEDFSIENINRQAGSNYHTVGRNKAEVVADEILRINPYARVQLHTQGVTPENIEEFVAGADIVVDETEYTHPELGVMIARASRAANIPVSMVLNVGHGARMISFHPEAETFEDYLGIDPEATLEEVVANSNPDLKRWVGRVPRYANMQVFEQVAGEEISAPSLITGVSAASSIAASQVANIILSDITPSRDKSVVWAPEMGMIDSVDNIKVISPKSQLGFYASAAFAAYNTRRGHNPPYDH